MFKRRKLWIVTTLVITIAFLVSCSSMGSDQDEARGYDMPKSEAKQSYDMVTNVEMTEESTSNDSIALAGESTPQSIAGAIDEDIQDKIIYYVNLDMVVDDPVDISEMIIDKTNSLGGYIGYYNMNKNGSNGTYVNLQIRIPSKNLEAIEDYAASIGEITNKNMDAETITEQYYDIMQRLETEELQARKLEEIMELAVTIEDILAVREHLAIVERNIESYKGKLKFWDSQVDFSTVTISIRATPSIDNAGDGPRLITLGETGRGVVRALKNSAITVVNVLSFLLRVFAALLIPAAIILPIFFLIRYLVRKYRAKRGIVKMSRKEKKAAKEKQRQQNRINNNPNNPNNKK